jgi:hypothetical protein
MLSKVPLIGAWRHLFTLLTVLYAMVYCVGVQKRPSPSAAAAAVRIGRRSADQKMMDSAFSASWQPPKARLATEQAILRTKQTLAAEADVVRDTLSTQQQLNGCITLSRFGLVWNIEPVWFGLVGCRPCV